MSAPAATSKDQALDETEARILDAARRQFELLGVKKTTIGDIARQAGVDRGTIYRRIGSREDLVQAVTAREVRGLLGELEAIPDRHESVESVIVDLFVTVITRWRGDRLVGKILALEPGRLLPQLTTEGGPVFTMAVVATTTLLGNAIEKRKLPGIPDLATRVEVAARIVHSLILQPVGGIDVESAEQLAEFAHRQIVPLIIDRSPAS